RDHVGRFVNQFTREVGRLGDNSPAFDTASNFAGVGARRDQRHRLKRILRLVTRVVFVGIKERDQSALGRALRALAGGQLRTAQDREAAGLLAAQRSRRRPGQLANAVCGELFLLAHAQKQQSPRFHVAWIMHVGALSRFAGKLPGLEERRDHALRAFVDLGENPPFTLLTLKNGDNQRVALYFMKLPRIRFYFHVSPLRNGTYRSYKSHRSHKSYS